MQSVFVINSIYYGIHLSIVEMVRVFVWFFFWHVNFILCVSIVCVSCVLTIIYQHFLCCFNGKGPFFSFVGHTCFVYTAYKLFHHNHSSTQQHHQTHVHANACDCVWMKKFIVDWLFEYKTTFIDLALDKEFKDFFDMNVRLPPINKYWESSIVSLSLLCAVSIEISYTLWNKG